MTKIFTSLAPRFLLDDDFEDDPEDEDDFDEDDDDENDEEDEDEDVETWQVTELGRCR